MSKLHAALCLLAVIGSVPSQATPGAKIEGTQTEKTLRSTWRFPDTQSSENILNYTPGVQTTGETNQMHNKRLCYAARSSQCVITRPEKPSESEQKIQATCNIPSKKIRKHSLKHLARHNFHRLVRFLATHILTDKNRRPPLTRLIMHKLWRAKHSFNALYLVQKQPKRNKPQADEYYAVVTLPTGILLMQHAKYVDERISNINAPVLAGIRRAVTQTLRPPPPMLEIAQQALAQQRHEAQQKSDAQRQSAG